MWQPSEYAPWPTRAPGLWCHLPSGRKASAWPGRGGMGRGAPSGTGTSLPLISLLRTQQGPLSGDQAPAALSTRMPPPRPCPPAHRPDWSPPPLPPADVQLLSPGPSHTPRHHGGPQDSQDSPRPTDRRPPDGPFHPAPSRTADGGAKGQMRFSALPCTPGNCWKIPFLAWPGPSLGRGRDGQMCACTRPVTCKASP